MTEELQRKKERLKKPEAVEEFYRLAILKAIDECWVEEVDSLQQLKGVVSTRKVGMTDYYKESLQSYQQLSARVREVIIRNIMLSSFELSETGKLSIYFV